MRKNETITDPTPDEIDAIDAIWARMTPAEGRSFWTSVRSDAPLDEIGTGR